MRMLFAITTVAIFAVSAEAAELIRLPRQATSPIKSGKGVPGTEANLAGWLVLNGASFRNDEFPELAKILQKDDKRSGGKVAPETTPLPFEPFEVRPTGEMARGYAICPSPAICGDLLGTVMPFNLNTSL